MRTISTWLGVAGLILAAYVAQKFFNLTLEQVYILALFFWGVGACASGQYAQRAKANVQEKTPG